MNDERRDESKDEEMICGLTVDERDALRRSLAALPDTTPPRAVWNRIREQAEAEGLINGRRPRPNATWLAGSGLAAAAVLAAIVMRPLWQTAEPEFSATPDPATTELVSEQPLTVLEALMVESRELESDLRSLPAEPRVVRAGTQATILDLEDRIGAIDYQLSNPAVELTAEEEEIFWRERVRLMKILVGLRYAQAQRTAF